MVVTGIAALFSFAACYFGFMAILALAHHRPLNLRADPATVAGVSDYLHHEGMMMILDAIRGSEAVKIPTLFVNEPRRTKLWNWASSAKTSLRRSPFYTAKEAPSSEKLSSSWHGSGGKPRTQDWRPRLLYSRSLLSFRFVLITTATALIILHSFVVKGQLYRSAFVYEVQVGTIKVQNPPISVGSTLLAVSLALCWNSIDWSLRVLQPYFSMSKAPTKLSKRAYLSYQTSHWIWAGTKAALKNHWLLSLVTFSTTLFQICKSKSPPPYANYYLQHIMGDFKVDLISRRNPNLKSLWKPALKK